MLRAPLSLAKMSYDAATGTLKQRVEPRARGSNRGPRSEKRGKELDPR